LPHDSTLPNGRYGAYRTRLTDAYLATALRAFAQIGLLRSPTSDMRQPLGDICKKVMHHENV